jgi:hypothetical protein
MQLDAEEDGAPFGHSSPPAGITTVPPISASTTKQDIHSEDSDRPATAESTKSDDVAAAAALTRELEE